MVPGGGTPDARDQLASLTADGLLAGPVASHADARALLAGLWLWHDFLDESHAISQALDSPTGSFWHAILHRREGDFANAKYWYARCRNHPALAEMGTRAARLAPDPHRRGDAAVEGRTRTPWEPDAFVDRVARVHRHEGSPPDRDAVRLQQIEWAALFDHCIREASGR